MRVLLERKEEIVNENPKIGDTTAVPPNNRGRIHVPS